MSQYLPLNNVMDFQPTNHFYFSLGFCNPISSLPKLQVDKFKCSVVGCIKPHNSLHRPPASEPLRSSWLDFFHGNVPTSVGKLLFVSTRLFKDKFFISLHQYLGFAKRLHLIKGSVPSFYGNNEHSKAVS
ncbi:hypothetical protein CHARACLAT_017610 [Characodon lateralis]|uniref:Uncharacterized protein n=1 Tax=Characodon lateralis TaxID=208331 RepID=A0ABU7D0D6_9TELE|nr:hypothetical protein [Characodon lateralis]